jgi:hypothetical protein
MRSRAVFLFALGVVFGLGLGCSPTPPADPQVSGPVGVVRFPGPWVKVIGDGQRVVNDTPHYVVRRSARGELLFAVKQGFTGEQFGGGTSDFPVKNPLYDYYSDSRYAVSLGGGVRVRPAAVEEWDAAEKVLHSYHFIQTFKNPQVTEEGVRHGGRLFRKTGESWGTEAALVSPRGTWIAVFSYASRERPEPALVPGFGGTEPGHGEVFLDLYDTSSGAKVISARAPYGGRGGGFAPSMLFGGSLWVEDRYFIMPLVWWLDACLIGSLPER